MSSSKNPQKPSSNAKVARPARKRLAMALEQRFLLDAAAAETLAETAAQQAAQEAAEQAQDESSAEAAPGTATVTAGADDVLPWADAGSAAVVGEQKVAEEPVLTVASAVIETLETEPVTGDTPVSQGLVLETASVSPALEQACSEATRLANEFLQQDGARDEVFSLFNGGESTRSPEWDARFDALMNDLREGGGELVVEIRSHEEMLGAWGAFSAEGVNGPTVYLNGDWLACQPGSDALKHVLLEEIGHYIDHRVNDGRDTAGDEGERFADHLSGWQRDADSLARISAEDDHVVLRLDGRDTRVEMASLLFSSASYFVGTSSADQTATLEQNVLVVGAQVNAAQSAVKYLFTSDPSTDFVFSGNNVRGTLYAINASNQVVGTYYGEIARLLKSGSNVQGFQMYVYGSGQTSASQSDPARVSILINSTAPLSTFTAGNTIRTSSDPVHVALNALLAAGTGNTAPVANADTATAVEAGGVSNGTAGTNPTGNVITSSDTDSNQTYVNSSGTLVLVGDALVVVRIASVTSGNSALPTAGTTSANGSAVAGAYGTLTIGADGSYSYVVDNANTSVQALRLSSQTLTETYSYKISDGRGGYATTTLTITLQGANDNPAAVDDYNVAKESIALSNQYTVSDATGFKATGNVLNNDSDVDSVANGETKEIVGLVATATGTTASSTSALIFSTDPGNNVKAGYLVWDNSGNPLMSNGSPSVQLEVDTKVVAANGQCTVTLTGTPFVDISNFTSLQFSQNSSSAKNSATFADVTVTAGPNIDISARTTVTQGTIAIGMTVSTSDAGVTIPAGTTVTAVTYNGSGVVTRITLSNSISASATNLTFTAAQGTTVTGRYGTLALNQNGSYTYTPTDPGNLLTVGQSGTEDFRYQMRDTALATSTASLFITVLGSANTDPNAVVDTVSATEAGGTANGTAGTDPTGNVLTNDTASTTVVAASSAQASTVTTLSSNSATAPGGAQYDAAVTGAYGTLYLKSDGSYQYVVNNSNATVQALVTGGTLTDLFQYKIQNGSGEVDWATLTVTVNGAYDAPVAVNDSHYAIANASDATGNVLTNDTDVDAGDTKVVSRVIAGTGSLPSSENVTGSTTSTSGYTSVTGSYGTLRIGSDGSYVYIVDTTNPTVAALAAGAILGSLDVFTYQVKDADGLVSTATLSMTVEGSNQAPVNGVPSNTITINQDASFTFTGAGNLVTVSDVDSNISSVTVSVSNGTLSISQVGATTSGSNETLEVTLAGGRHVLRFPNRQPQWYQQNNALWDRGADQCGLGKPCLYPNGGLLRHGYTDH